MHTRRYATDFFCGSLFYLCPSLALHLVCVLQPCVHLLGKGQPLGASVCVIFMCFCHFPIRCPGSGVVLDFIIYLQRKTPDTTPSPTQKYKILYHYTRVIFSRISISLFYPPNKHKTQHLTANGNQSDNNTLITKITTHSI